MTPPALRDKLIESIGLDQGWEESAIEMADKVIIPVILEYLQSPEMVRLIASKIWDTYGGCPFDKCDNRCKTKYIGYSEAAIQTIVKRLK